MKTRINKTDALFLFFALLSHTVYFIINLIVGGNHIDEAMLSLNAFSLADKVNYELSFFDLPECKTEYGEDVTYKLKVPSEKSDALAARIKDVTAAKAVIKIHKP